MDSSGDSSGEPEEVTGSSNAEVPLSFAVPPASPEGPVLEAAELLSLALVPAAPEAVALVGEVTRLVASREAHRRKRRRRAGGEADLRRAVGALVGGVLRRWTGSPPRLASRKTSSKSFSGSPLTHDLFVAARDGMVALGLLGYESGKRFKVAEEFGAAELWSGRVSRFWPTVRLLRLAEAHGLQASSVRRAFRTEAPKAPPEVPDPVEVRGFAVRSGGQKHKGAPVPFDADRPEFKRAKREVEEQNAHAAAFRVEGCTPPRWRRVFSMDWRLGGRWYAVGRDPLGVYLNLPEADRLQDIRIDGEPVVEVDISASHLTILHGLLGLPLPDGDLYATVPGVPRKVVKAWLTVTLGRGVARPVWSRTSSVEQRSCSAAAIHDAMLADYPFLADLASVVPADLRAAHGDRRELVPLFLQGVEAVALTSAIGHVRSKGHLALPTHDGLIVARSAERWAREGVEGAFVTSAGVSPRLDVSRAPDASDRDGAAPQDT